MTDSRPLGVTLLAGACLFGVFAFGALGLGFAAGLGALDYTEAELRILTPVLTGTFLTIAATFGLLAYGLLRGARWAWWLLLGVVGLLLALSGPSVAAARGADLPMGLAWLAALALVVVYATRPGVRRWFHRGKG